MRGLKEALLDAHSHSGRSGVMLLPHLGSQRLEDPKAGSPLCQLNSCGADMDSAGGKRSLGFPAL